MTDYKGIKTFNELIDREHGPIGSDSRNEYEQRAQMFIVSEMLKEARKEAEIIVPVFPISFLNVKIKATVAIPNKACRILNVIILSPNIMNIIPVK